MKTLEERIADHSMPRGLSKSKRINFANNTGYDYGYDPSECEVSDEFLEFDMKWSKEEIAEYAIGVERGKLFYDKWCEELVEEKSNEETKLINMKEVTKIKTPKSHFTIILKRVLKDFELIAVNQDFVKEVVSEVLQIPVSEVNELTPLTFRQVKQVVDICTLFISYFDLQARLMLDDIRIASTCQINFNGETKHYIVVEDTVFTGTLEGCREFFDEQINLNQMYQIDGTTYNPTSKVYLLSFQFIENFNKLFGLKTSEANADTK